MAKAKAMDEVDDIFEIYAITEKTGLRDSLEKISQVGQIVQLPEIQKGVQCKSVVVDGSCITHHHLNEIREYYPDQEIFFILSNITNETQLKNVVAQCAAYKIHMLDEHLTLDQIKEEVHFELFQSRITKRNKIVGFFGTHSGAGVSTTAINVADVLSRCIDGKVLLLSLNAWDPADYFLDYKGKYLSDLNVELKTGSLTDERLLDSIHQYSEGSFYHLAGNRDIKLQRYFQTEQMAQLIQMVEKHFDIILIDGGCHFDNAVYAQSYKASEMKFLVTTQEPKGYQGYWPHIFHQIIEPLGGKSEDFMLLVNQIRPEVTLATYRDISEALDMDVLAIIPDEGFLGPTSIAQKTLLNQSGASSEYIRSLESIVNSIVVGCGLSLKSNVELFKQKKGFINRLFTKKSKATG
ncbi:ParA family protein [Peribacillus loiseleuriae]|uniref:ParA family protein n=1 Tax=Peribacillus loiseleuriae TaxID=1679170 RepID=UPI003CFBD3DE